MNTKNIPTDTCSKCEQDFLHCMCLTFHPNVEKWFVLTREEVIELQEYFYKRAGWMSPEFDVKILEIIKRIDNFIKEIK